MRWNRRIALLGVAGMPVPGVEVGIAASVLGLGFVVATATLHLAGLAIGLVLRAPAGMVALRVGGGAIAVAGVALLVGS